MSGTTSASPGNWITESINGMQYEVLLPANYNPDVEYPVVLYLHQLDMGDDPSGLLAEVNPWFNTTAFRTDYPSIVVMPLLNQTADPSGETINWGGVSTADSAGEDNAIAALQQVMSTYSVDPSRVYVTGNSMGGIGTEDMMIKYNAYNGTEGRIFTAGLALAGVDYGQGFPTPTPSVVTELKNVPLMTIHGAQDTTDSPMFDQNLYAAEQAIGGDNIYIQDATLAHDVWDTYYTEDGAGSPLNWLFSQSSNGVLASTQPGDTLATTITTPSPNDSIVTAGSTGAIVDGFGNEWTITSGGQVAINGVADTSTANVVELAYVQGTVWQENSSGQWFGETQPSMGWDAHNGSTSPLQGTPIVAPAPTVTPAPSASPTPTAQPSANDTVVQAGSTAEITDASGNQWTITGGGQVAVNGVADTTTANVIELAYVNGTVWQENSADLWWGKTSPTASWSPSTGTATSPLPAATPAPTSAPTPAPTSAPTLAPTPAPTPAPTASPNDTVVQAGSSAAITDTAGDQWTITRGGEVAVNGTADTTTANVIELAYVNGTVWQENSADLWWGKTSPTASWSPSAGTATSPVPPTVSANDSVVLAGSTGAITDASGNAWTITSSGQIAVNGVADPTTANVKALAYVNGTVWQENANAMWWGKTSPTASWSPSTGTATSPLPAGDAIVAQSQISTTITSAASMVFVAGFGDTVTLTGNSTVNETGSGNTYVLPKAASVTFASNILAGTDKLDLRMLLAGTNWNGASSSLSQYLSVAGSTKGAVFSVSATAGGAGVAFATVDGATTASLSTLLAHAIT